MAEEMQPGLDFADSSEQRHATPIGAVDVIKDGKRWFMGDDVVCPFRNQTLGMTVSQAEECPSMITPLSWTGSPSVGPSTSGFGIALYF